MAFEIARHPSRASHGRYANTYDFKLLMDWSADAKWPATPLAPRNVLLNDGRVTPMWVIPAPKPIFRLDGRKVKTSSHRCFCRCPDCHAIVPAGRTTQHVCKKD